MAQRQISTPDSNSWAPAVLFAAGEGRQFLTSYVAVGYHGPIAVRSSNETILGSGDLGVVENSGMVGRIDSGQAARRHGASSRVTAIALRPCRRPGQGQQGCKRDRATKHIPSTDHISLHWVHSEN